MPRILSLHPCDRRMSARGRRLWGSRVLDSAAGLGGVERGPATDVVGTADLTGQAFQGPKGLGLARAIFCLNIVSFLQLIGASFEVLAHVISNGRDVTVTTSPKTQRERERGRHIERLTRDYFTT